MKISIVRSICLGCGVCVGFCPAVFELDGSKIAVVKHTPAEGLEAGVREAAECCPIGAIRLEGAPG